MAKRLSMSLKNRFNVFKRDFFKCKYCGRGVPDVILEVDHITPVSKGGDNSSNNLITSCFECNRGKSDILINDIPESIESTLKKEIELRKERRKQVQRLDKELRKLKDQENMVLDDLGVYWWDKFVSEDKKGTTVFANKRLSSLKTFLKHLTPEQIKEFSDLAYDKVVQGFNRSSEENSVWKYFCGICWAVIRGKNVQ